MNLLITGSASDNVYHITMSLDGVGVARRGFAFPGEVVTERGGVGN